MQISNLFSNKMQILNILSMADEAIINVNLGPEESVPWDIKGIHVLNETFEVNYSIPLHHSASLQSVEDEAKVHKEGPPSSKFQLGMYFVYLSKKNQESSM